VEHRRPDVPVPGQHRGDPDAPAVAAAAPGEPASLGELRWQDLIRDEQLDALIQEALAGNYEVQIAAARVLEAQARFTIARSQRLPSVDAQAGYTRLRSSETGSTPLPPGYPPEYHYSRLAAGLSWELDFWGRARNAAAAARAQLFASVEAQRVVVQSLVSEVAQNYFLLRDLDLEKEITQRSLRARKESLDLVRMRVEGGYSSEIDLRQAEALVKSARTALIVIERQIEETENNISFLLGRSPGPVPRGRPLLEMDVAARLPAGLPSGLLERRPDIRQAEQELVASEAEVAVARAAYFPVMSLTGAGGFESNALRNLLRTSNNMWTVSPAGLLPIFTGGRVKAGVRAARARQQQAMLRYRQAASQAFREVADALAAYRKSTELREMQEGLAGSLRQAVELADLRYRGGVSSYLEYLDSERELLDAELRLVRVRREELASIVTLYRALGGGWQ
jgi:multidrug efflux system outer membrane protein